MTLNGDVEIDPAHVAVLVPKQIALGRKDRPVPPAADRDHTGCCDGWDCTAGVAR